MDQQAVGMALQAKKAALASLSVAVVLANANAKGAKAAIAALDAAISEMGGPDAEHLKAALHDGL